MTPSTRSNTPGEAGMLGDQETAARRKWRVDLSRSESGKVPHRGCVVTAEPMNTRRALEHRRGESDNGDVVVSHGAENGTEGMAMQVAVTRD